MNSLGDAIATVAEAHDIPFNRDTTTTTLSTHSAFYAAPDSYVQLRIATNGRKSQLNYRAEVFSPHAQELLTNMLRPEDCAGQVYLGSVMRELNTCAVAVDGDPLKGLVKLWQAGTYTVERLAGVRGCPEAVRAHLGFLEKHDFARVYFTGIDLTKKSMNVYFSLRESRIKTTDEILEIFREIGFNAPEDETVLDHLTGAGAFAMTFNWESLKPERICFYMSVLDPDGMPSDWRRFMKECALPHESTKHATEDKRERDFNLNSCFVSRSFGPQESDQYFKLESDWHRDYHELLMRIADFKPTRDNNNIA